MAQNKSFARSFNAVKTNNSSGYNLVEWNLKVNNELDIVKNNPQIISIVRTSCGGLFKCTNCGHKWTKKLHSTILFQCDKVQRTIECKLFGHNCLECHNNPTYHIADYNSKEIEDTIEFLRKELLRKLHPGMIPHEEHRERGGRQYGPTKRNYNVDFANYCESCQRGDYCRLHGRNSYN